MGKAKIIFLDIDGVVNTIQIDTEPFDDVGKKVDIFYYDMCYNSNGRVSNRQAVMWLNKLCRDTGANIVISSTWRYCNINGRTPEECLRNTGLLPEIKVLGSTPIFPSGCRRDEIKYWLSDNFKKDEYSFVILDDDNDMGDIEDHLVLCNTYHGFGFPEYEKAKEILNKE